MGREHGWTNYRNEVLAIQQHIRHLADTLTARIIPHDVGSIEANGQVDSSRFPSRHEFMMEITSRDAAGRSSLDEWNYLIRDTMYAESPREWRLNLPEDDDEELLEWAEHLSRVKDAVNGAVLDEEVCTISRAHVESWLSRVHGFSLHDAGACIWVGTNGVGRCNGEGPAQLQRRWQRGDPRRWHRGASGPVGSAMRASRRWCLRASLATCPAQIEPPRPVVRACTTLPAVSEERGSELALRKAQIHL